MKVSFRFSNSVYCQRQDLPILPGCRVLGKDINRMEELFYKIFVLITPYFVLSVFFFPWRLQNIGHCFLHEVKIQVVFILKIYHICTYTYCFLFARFFMIADFERVSIVCALALLKSTKRLVSPNNWVYLSLCDSRKNRSSFDISFSREIWRGIYSPGCKFFYTVLPKGWFARHSTY